MLDELNRLMTSLPGKETRVTVIDLTLLTMIFFLTSIVSVVTGSTSLITVPGLFQFGVEPRTALATNMLALTFMSVGGTLPFIGKSVIDRRRLPLLIVLTLISSTLGALLVFLVPSKAIPLIVSLAMMAVALFSMMQPQAAVSITKLINIFSSLIATLVFMWRGLIDYRLGILLSVAMFMGASIGGRLALKMSNVWLRCVFLLAVVLLALKILLYDVLGKMLLLAG